ncbi:hypothetical protein ACFCV3_09255 [Kribbella sp. NPDC056345]|uniref:hypothetical protein n=1 Tax=Kribbella sp. NPDC056345 TaxID=3345789 RepID=UPI0035E082A9
MADEAEEMLEILFKQIRKLVRGLDRYRQQLERNRQAQMPRPLIEEIRNIRTHNPDIDRAMNDRPPADQYARLEQQLQVLREREADLQRQLDDRQRELEANQDLNQDGNPDNSVDDRDELDEVTDDVDERDEQEQQDEREREEQEQREREEEERRREEEEKRKREEEERKRQEEEKRETGTPNPQLPIGAAAAAPALDDDFDQTAEQMQADYEADREQSRESMEAQRQEIAEQQREQMENWDGLGNREVMEQMRTEAEQRGELPPREVDETRNQQDQAQEAPEQEQTETRQEQVQQQERVEQEQRDEAQQEQPDQAQDPQEQTQEQVREQQEREPQAQEDREQQAESVESVEQEGLDGEGPESRREQETERQQEEDREQADVGTGEGFATGGDHQVANEAAEQAEQPDGRVQAVDQVLEQERLDRENQRGANPQDGSNRPGMSPDEIRQAQEQYSAGTPNPSGAVSSPPNGEALDGARGGQTAGQVHAKTTQRGSREQSSHELKKG